jgi:hypothetical protein
MRHHLIKMVLVGFVATAAVDANAAIITLSGVGAGPLTGTYVESGFTIDLGDDTYGTTIGGAAALINDPTSTTQPLTELTLQLTDLGTFTFSSIDVGNFNGSFPSAHVAAARDSGITVLGSLNGTTKFLTVLDATSGVMTTQNSASNLPIDKLLVVLGNNGFPTDIEGVTNISVTSTAPTPEPSTLILMGAGMLALTGAARRRSAARASSTTWRRWLA